VNDEPRDDELNEDAPGDDAPSAEDAPPENAPAEDTPAEDAPAGEAAEEAPTEAAPPPRTAAGRARAGGEASDEAEKPDEPDAGQEGAPPSEDDPDEAASESVTEAEDEPEAEKKPSGQETVEADTLAIADREAEQEAAHKGLKERAEKSATERVSSTGAQAAVAAAVATPPANGAGDPPKRNVWWRFLAASFVIVASMAAATSIAFLLFLTDIGNDLKGDETFAAAVEGHLAGVEGGAPQTILILGSDKRTGTGEEFGRSDTTMLLRVDPEKEFLALLSLPRDLSVEIPGYGTDKLNAAYSVGGPDLTLRTVKELLGIDINHIVNVDFEGFYDAINAIGCVYIDVDRHYFNPQGGEYDAIDIKPGYRKLCGYTALDYVRYRHNDNDLVRGARQQSFVREARQQIPPRSLLPPPFGDAELIDIFTQHTRSDIDDPPTIIDMLKSFVDVRNAPVRQVSLGELSVDGGVEANGEQVETAVNRFLGNDLEEPESEPEPIAPEPDKEKQKKKDEEEKPEEPAEPALVDVSGVGAEKAKEYESWLRRHKAHLPVFYPTAVVDNINAGISEESLAYSTEAPDPKDPKLYGYKFVLPYQESFGTSYYGVTGINWTKPPILNNPSEVREVDGREYLLFYEQDRLRLVGWTTDSGAYWVNNTLTRALSEDQMLAVANAVREYDE
jgi:polyisoprenyl-teichoic acid--peptidoglycan teichoic acid transferase